MIAVDGARGPFARPAAAKVESIEGVWFRGARCDITGGSGSCWPVATIIRGTVVMRDDEVIAPHRGEPVRFNETLAP